ncbi:unnamed protein product [Calypogeia fissa]
MSLNYKENSLVVPKLEGSEDYDAWQDLISGTLASAGGWKFVDSTAVPPVQESDEKQYLFQARSEAYYAQAAHARMIIITACKPHIQTTLAKIPTADGCWEKLRQRFQPQGLIQKHIHWKHFVRMKYQCEDMQTFGNKYRDAINRCVSAGIQIDPDIQTLQFISILEGHYEHWAVNKYEQMRQDPILASSC